MSNPADFPQRGSNSFTLSNNQLWLHGQVVLSQSDFPDSAPSIQLACCRTSSRGQLTVKGARRVDGQNSSVVTPNTFVAVTNSTAFFVTTVDDVLDLDFKHINSITLLLSMRKKASKDWNSSGHLGKMRTYSG